MKFTCSVTIDLPINQVVALFSNPENLPKWQTGFVSMKRLSGTDGAKDSQTLFVYKHGRNVMELKETILTNKLPEVFLARYEHKHMLNTMENRFVADDNKTVYTAHIEYTKFIGILPKLMGFLFPSMFQKQTQKWLNQFKAFAESER